MQREPLYNGKAKALISDAKIEFLAFHVRLEDRVMADYEAAEISRSVENEVDPIVSPFARLVVEQ